MMRLFISYARKDGRDVADLVAAGVGPREAWLDRNEIAGGEVWTGEIETAIDACDVFLAVLTPMYGESRICRNELSRALRLEKRRIPLLAHPKADPTLLFEGLHWIDFTDSTARDASMRALIESIDHPAEAEAAKPANLEWKATVARGAKQARRFVRQLQGTFNADLYVRRDAAEQDLAQFIAGDAPASIVLGDSGVGKTNLICHWTLDLLEQGHAVLAYDCSALPEGEVEKEIARDLAVPADELTDALERIDAGASNAERRLIIIFESVGDYAYGPDELLRKIHSFAGRIGDNTRIVLSCNDATWNRVQRSRPIRFDRAQCVQLGLFTDQELDRAYLRYREFFQLRSELADLAPAVRERLREPVLLRLTAEAFGKSKDPLPPTNLAAGVYKRFFEERVRTDNEKILVDELAEEMIRRRTSTLAMNELARDDRLGPKLLREDAGAPYFHLLDCGVLQELRNDARAGTLIKFAHTRLAAYALASHLWKQSEDVKTAAAALVAQDADFPLAWEIAKTLLLISGNRGAIAALAASTDSEQRELAAEALVELHAEDPSAARELLQSLFQQEQEEGRRTALKAAYNIGPRMQDFFLRAAIEGAPSTREAVSNTLYLIWRRTTTEAFYLIWKQSPEFTYEILDKLIDELRPRNLLRAPAIFSFAVDLIVTIYINHCDEPRVIDKTAELLHKLWVDRLHLDVPGSWFEKIVSRVLGAVFGKQIFDWMLFELSAKEFFALPKTDRDRLGRIGDLFDPASDLAAAHDDLAVMLRSGISIYRGSAAMAVAVHAGKDFATTKPLVDALWNADIGAEGRLWLLAGFSVLIKGTPGEWVGLLETLTGSYVNDHDDAFRGDASRLPGKLDVVFLPLGLAYGKSGARSMPFFEALLQKGMAKNDTALLTRCVAALGVVGFYYPEAMFETIRPLMTRIGDSAIRTALVANLATVRILHFDAVDRFLSSAGAPDDLRRDIDVAADVQLVRRYIRVLGYYNNAVHFTLNYPRMRKPLSTGSLKLMATARDGNQFVAQYTATVMGMLRDSGYQVLEWTRPE